MLNSLRILLQQGKYHYLAESGNPLQEVAKHLADTTENEAVKELVTFVLNTKRGIPFNRK